MFVEFFLDNLGYITSFRYWRSSETKNKPNMNNVYRLDDLEGLKAYLKWKVTEIANYENYEYKNGDVLLKQVVLSGK